jgi:Ca2+-binding EF-hand superfamily protein
VRECVRERALFPSFSCGGHVSSLSSLQASRETEKRKRPHFSSLSLQPARPVHAPPRQPKRTPGKPHSPPPPPPPPFQNKFQNTQTVNQAEIEALYRRFRALDRGRKGFLTAEEVTAIPELSINPLAKLLERQLEGNFKNFVGVLAAASSHSSWEDRVRLIFAVFDADGDGIVSRADLALMVRALAGSGLGEAEVDGVVAGALAEAGERAAAAGVGGGSGGGGGSGSGAGATAAAGGEGGRIDGLRLDDFRRALARRELAMAVAVPTDY